MTAFRNIGAKTGVIAVPYNGRVWLHFPCATKCRRAGRTLETAMSSDTESLNFSTAEARALARGLLTLADAAESGVSIDLEAPGALDKLRGIS